MSVSFDGYYKYALPWWLTSGTGGYVFEAQMGLLDASIYRLREGLTARFPSYAGDSALELIGADRGIIRGRDEPSDRYARRLLKWRGVRGHRTRGNDYALLDQLAAYFGAIDGYVIDGNGTQCSRALDETESYAFGVTWDWDVQGWAQFWIVLNPSGLFSSHPDWDDPRLWDGNQGSAHSFGILGFEAADTEVMRSLLYSRRPWRPAGTQPEWLVVSLDGATVVPADTWVRWGYDSGGGVYAPLRPGNLRFVSLKPDHNNRYAGNPDSYATSVVTTSHPAGYAGDPDAWSTTIGLSDGNEYSGNDASFPDNALLLDDGDLAL